MPNKLKYPTQHYAEIHRRVVTRELAEMRQREFDLISHQADPELCGRFAEWVETKAERIYLNPDHPLNAPELWMNEASYFAARNFTTV